MFHSHRYRGWWKQPAPKVQHKIVEPHIDDREACFFQLSANGSQRLEKRRRDQGANYFEQLPSKQQNNSISAVSSLDS